MHGDMVSIVIYSGKFSCGKKFVELKNSGDFYKSKFYLLPYVHCIACIPVNYAYVFVSKMFVEVSLPTKIMNFLPHKDYPLYIR